LKSGRLTAEKRRILTAENKRSRGFRREKFELLRGKRFGKRERGWFIGLFG